MQQTFDGMQVDSRQARFTGVFDLDDEDTGVIGLDRVSFFVVAVRDGGAALKLTNDGDVKRVDSLAVQDARLMTGELRDKAVEFLSGRSGQEVFSFSETVVDDDEEEEPNDVAAQPAGEISPPENGNDRSGTMGVAKYPGASSSDIRKTDVTPREVESVSVYGHGRTDEALAAFLRD